MTLQGCGQGSRGCAHATLGLHVPLLTLVLMLMLLCVCCWS